MAQNDEVWIVARAIWEVTPVITLQELAELLQEAFGTAPSQSAIHRKIKQQGWQKKSPKLQTNARVEKQNNKVAILTDETVEKIEQQMESLVLDAHARKQIILKHRRRIKQLGELQDDTIGTLQSLHGLDRDLDSEAIKTNIVVADAISRTLDKLTGVQKTLFEQEMLVCGITSDDFMQSEQERRMQSLDKLGDLNDQEKQARADKVPQLMQRLLEFEQLEHTPDESV